MTVELRIHGGRIHGASGATEADLLISGEKVIGIVAPTAPVSATDTLDVSGLDIIPGLVDIHAHTRVPGLEHKEDYVTASRAAAVGGVTTFVDMPNVEPPTDSVELYLEKRAIADRDSIVDWGHYASASNVPAIEGLAAAGVTGFKIYMVGGGFPHDDRIAVLSHDLLFDALRTVAPTGLPCLIHPFDEALFELFTRDAVAAGKLLDYRTRVEIYSGIDIIWRSAIATLIEFQRETNARVHVLHTHARGSLELLRQAKASGSRLTASIDPRYFHLTREDMERQGPRASNGAVVTSEPERLALIWESLRDGTLDTIDSDHGPHTLTEVEGARQDAWKFPTGNAQYDDVLSVMLTDVHEGTLTLQDLVRLWCENPARLLGRFPEKGALRVGSDADLVVLDMKATRLIRDEDVESKVHWTPYAGRTVTGVPVITMLRGRTIAEGRKVVGEPGYGRYLEGRPLEWSRAAPTSGAGLALSARRDAR